MATRLKRPSTCAICRHPERERIEALRAGGASLRAVALRFGLSGKNVVHRHFNRHVTPERRAALMLGSARFEALANQAAAESRTLLERMNIATSILFGRFLACAEAQDDHALANIAGRLNALFRDYAHLTGELREASTVTINNAVNIISSPEFLALQDGLISIARAVPGARTPIIELLEKIVERPAGGPNGSGAPPALIEGELAHVE